MSFWWIYFRMSCYKEKDDVIYSTSKYLAPRNKLKSTKQKWISTVSKRFQRLYLERLNYLGITRQVLGPNVTKLFCKNAWTRKNCKTSVSKLFFFLFLEFKTILSHSYSSNKQLFWTPPIFPDQAHVYSGGKYTHTQLQTEKSLAQEYFYFN